jgi:hypothetical protein
MDGLVGLPKLVNPPLKVMVVPAAPRLMLPVLRKSTGFVIVVPLPFRKRS